MSLSGGDIALVVGFGSTLPLWRLDILWLTGFFVALWLISARLPGRRRVADRTGRPISARPHSSSHIYAR